MKHSTGRFLTTHTGSLPRRETLTKAMFAKEDGVPVDPAALAAEIAGAVGEVVARQRAAGVDIVNDGEMSKPSYATYIKDRLAGFGGTSHPLQYQDLVDFPELQRRVFSDPGRSRRKTPGCTAPVRAGDGAAARADIANLAAAIRESGAEEGFLTAASPGLISLFFHNGHYPSHEAYLADIAQAMRPEYEAIVGAGFVLQLDCPDLAMAHHTSFQDLSEAEFLKRAAFHVETLNHALRNVPAEMCRIHICWGNYEGPHDHDIDFAKVAPILVKAKPMALVIEAANPRHAHEWAVWRDLKLPDDKILVAGVLDTSTNYVEHPELVAERLCRFADIVGRERVMAGTDCGFGTFAGYGKIDPDIAFTKLRAMADGAAIASKRLWGRA